MNGPEKAASIGESDIAVVGMSARFPGAANVRQFWNNLKNGVESVSFFSDAELIAAGVDPALLDDPNYVKAQPYLEGIDQFDARFFGYSPAEARLADPQHRLFMECAWQALEDAGVVFIDQNEEGGPGVRFRKHI